MKPAPYPPETRVKGWRFELDYEQIEQSDTWALAPAHLRPWLLMLWLTAWKQTPAGSMPSSDELIAARIGMPLGDFLAGKAVLLRGWWRADDGRLYHDTITRRVLDMETAKTKERDRKAAYRARMSQGNPQMSHGTDAGQPRDTNGTDPGRDATGTGTGTSNTPIPPIGGMPPQPPADLFPGAPAAPSPPVKRSRKAPVPAAEVLDVDPDAIAAWLQIRTKKRAGPINDIVLEGLDRERKKAGLTRQEAVKACVEYGWQGFTAEWYLQRVGGPGRRPSGAHSGLDEKPYHEGIDHDGHIL